MSVSKDVYIALALLRRALPEAKQDAALSIIEEVVEALGVDDLMTGTEEDVANYEQVISQL